jgi:hypothetical protein
LTIIEKNIENVFQNIEKYWKNNEKYWKIMKKYWKNIDEYWSISNVIDNYWKKYWKILKMYFKILKNIEKIMKNIEKIMKNNEKILKKYWRVSILINIKCIEGYSPNSTKISSIYCRTYFLNILSSNFSEGTLQVNQKNESPLLCIVNWLGIRDILYTFYVFQREIINNNNSLFCCKIGGDRKGQKMNMEIKIPFFLQMS